jgi:hypothetical protein
VVLGLYDWDPAQRELCSGTAVDWSPYQLAAVHLNIATAQFVGRTVRKRMGRASLCKHCYKHSGDGTAERIMSTVNIVRVAQQQRL